MPKSLVELKRHLSRIKPWIAVALLLAVFLAGYYFVLGTRYLSASGEVASIEEQIRQQRRTLRQKLPDEQTLKAERASGEQRLTELRALFTYQETGVLMGILTDTAEETFVNLERIDLVDSRTETLEGVQYRAVPVAATVQGDILDIYEFLSLLQRKVPVANISNIRLSDFEGSPKAQLQLLFYLLPETSSKN